MHENKYSLVNDARDSRFLAVPPLQTSRGRFRTGSTSSKVSDMLPVEHNASIDSVFLESSVLAKFAWAEARTAAVQMWRTGHVALAPTLSRLLSCRCPAGIGAVLGQQWTSLLNLRVDPNSLWLRLEPIESRGISLQFSYGVHILLCSMRGSTIEKRAGLRFVFSFSVLTDEQVSL
jgi:hypothetical protein